jgi:hypothetical protein
MAELVKVTLLKHTPLGAAGDTVEVPKPVADAMCAQRQLNDGHKLVSYRVAKPSEEIDYVAPIDLLTAADMQKAGKKNIIQTPGTEAPKFETPKVEVKEEPKVIIEKGKK